MSVEAVRRWTCDGGCGGHVETGLTDQPRGWRAVMVAPCPLGEAEIRFHLCPACVDRLSRRIVPLPDWT